MLTHLPAKLGVGHCNHSPFTLTIQSRGRFSMPNLDILQVPGRA
jgi:hypothetical protein